LDWSERVVRVKGYGPDDVGAQHGENERYLRDVEKDEKQNSIRQEATPDDELHVASQVQKRVGSPSLRLPVPDS
jgi:hypothetical protein